MRKAVRRALLRGNATIIGTGHGRQSARSALPKQLELAQTAHSLGVPRIVLRAVDTDGERPVVIIPKLVSPYTATYLGNRYRQRSIINGKEEYSTKDDALLTQFDEARVSTRKPAGFSTYIPEEGVYYQLRVRPHARSGRPVAGYATRRRRRRAR
jgi:hypothetical protein